MQSSTRNIKKIQGHAQVLLGKKDTLLTPIQLGMGAQVNDIDLLLAPETFNLTEIEQEASCWSFGTIALTTDDVSLEVFDEMINASLWLLKWCCGLSTTKKSTSKPTM